MFVIYLKEIEDMLKVVHHFTLEAPVTEILLQVE